MSQIEHPKFLQVANPAGYFRQIIVSQDESFETGLRPRPSLARDPAAASTSLSWVRRDHPA